MSKEEQLKRFLSRIDEPAKNWKFSAADARERGYWDQYMEAYEDAIRNTATKDAPWYVVPADNKWFTTARRRRGRHRRPRVAQPEFSQRRRAPQREELAKAKEFLLRAATAPGRRKRQARRDNAPQFRRCLARNPWSKLVTGGPLAPRVRPAWLRPDVVAGVTLAAYLLPAGIGDASLAGLPPEAGLYACLLSGLVFWALCSSRHTAITVTSAISLLTGFDARRVTPPATRDVTRRWPHARR